MLIQDGADTGETSYAQQTRDANPIAFQCWASVADNGPTLKLHWVNVSCLLGCSLVYAVIMHALEF